MTDDHRDAANETDAQESRSNLGRRALLAALAGTAAYAVVPRDWSRPFANFTGLPAHAALSNGTPGGPADAGGTPDPGGPADAGGTPGPGGPADAGGTPDAGGPADAGGKPDAGGPADAGVDAAPSACPVEIAVPHTKVPAAGVFMYWMVSLGPTTGTTEECSVVVAGPNEEGKYLKQMDVFLSFPANFPAAGPASWSVNPGPLSGPFLAIDSVVPAGTPRSFNTMYTFNARFKGTDGGALNTVKVVMQIDYDFATTPNKAPVLRLIDVQIVV
jgi:hypothetical protein